MTHAASGEAALFRGALRAAVQDRERSERRIPVDKRSAVHRNAELSGGTAKALPKPRRYRSISCLDEGSGRPLELIVIGLGGSGRRE